MRPIRNGAPRTLLDGHSTRIHGHGSRSLITHFHPNVLAATWTMIDLNSPLAFEVQVEGSKKDRLRMAKATESLQEMSQCAGVVKICLPDYRKRPPTNFG